MSESFQNPVPGQLSVQRLERLADLIFAFAIVVMVGDIVLLVEEYSTHEGGWAYIKADFQVASSFALNAAIIGYYWVTHQKNFSYYRRTDGRHVAFELVFLIVIITMPFSNYVMGLDQDGLTPIYLVSSEILLASVFLALSWAYATKNSRLTEPDSPTPDVRRSKLVEAGVVVPLTTVIAVLLALVHPLLWMPAFFVVPALLSALRVF